MKRKKDNNMYIDYKMSYRSRGKRGLSRLVKVFFVILLALGVGVGSYYLIANQIEVKRSNEDDKLSTQDKVDGDTEDTSLGSLTSDSTNQNAPNQENSLVDGLENDAETEPISDQEPDDITQGATDSIDGSIAQGSEEDTRNPIKVKGIYLTAGAARVYREALIDLADTTEINAMVIDIKDDHGKITYATESSLAQEIGAVTNGIPDMEGFLQTLKEKGIYTIARIVAFKDPYLAEQKHNMALKNKDGTLYRDNNGECWVNPYNQEVWDYLVEVATLAAVAGFDEVQFDYIRFSTGKGVDKIDYGEAAETTTKEEIIIEFTKYAYEKLKPLGIFVSADVYGTIISSRIDAGLVGQNYVEMAKYLDYICPMIYPSHFGEGNYGIANPDLEPNNIIRKVLTASKDKLEQIPEGEHKAVVRPWLQDFTASWLKNHKNYGGEELREQIKGVYEAGYEEWLLWNAGSSYSVEGLEKEYE